MPAGLIASAPTRGSGDTVTGGPSQGKFGQETEPWSMLLAGKSGDDATELDCLEWIIQTEMKI